MDMFNQEEKTEDIEALTLDITHAEQDPYSPHDITCDLLRLLLGILVSTIYPLEMH